MVQTQQENQARLARQKTVYERKLRGQEEQNRAVAAANAAVAREIAELRANNSALRRHAKELKSANRVRRAELRALHAKFGMALGFVQASLVHTDDSKAAALEVLAPKAPRRKKHRRHAFVEVAGQTSRGAGSGGDDQEDEDGDDEDGDD